MAQNTKITEASTVELSALTSGKASPPVSGSPLTIAANIDGNPVISAPLSNIKQIDIADVDLLLTMDNGERIVIPNGAVDALVKQNAIATFSNGTVPLYELFKHTGIAHPAKAGSLRLVTDNIDAQPPETTERHTSDDVAPPAPLAKTGPGIANGETHGRDDGEVPATFVPRVTAIPSTFSSGRITIDTKDIKNLTGEGTPNISANLFVSESFKLDPSGRADLPLGAYDASASADQLAQRSSPAGQSNVEKIYGTASADNIGFNPQFSADEGQWSKTLHIGLNNFSSVSSIQIVFAADKIAQIPGFNLTGTGVTRDSPSSNSWHVTPTSEMLKEGLNVNIVYDIMHDVTPVNFAANIVVDGMAGVLSYSVANSVYLTWRDAVTQEDFTVTNDTGTTLLVLPSGGVGSEIFAYGGNDVIHAGAGNDIIHGGEGNDTIDGGTGADLIEGGVGADSLDGGIGKDTADYSNSETSVLASLDLSLGLTNTGEAAGDTYTSIENLQGSAFADTLAGDAQVNTLDGGSGDDLLIGGAGADKLIGGTGEDTASYINATSSVVVNLATNTGSAGDANGDTLSAIENLTGGQANDTFISSADTVSNAYDGQGGHDTVSYEAATSAVTTSLTSGLSDIVFSNAALGDRYTSIENLIGTAYNDHLIGSSADNTLNGGSGDDTLEGLDGGDTFIGGTGSDTVSYAHSEAGIVTSLTTAFSIGSNVTASNDAVGDSYASIENLTGSAFADTLIGDSASNILLGGDGDDVLEGMGGENTLDGGAGSDTVSYEHSTSFVSVALTDGLSGFSPQGDAERDTIRNIENITGTNFNDLLIGDANNNILSGGAGDDTLQGLGGADSFIGGTGSNTVTYLHSPEASAGNGLTVSLTDTSLNTGDAVGDTFTNIQNLTGTANNDTLYGDSNANLLTGGSGDDTLYGLAGTDTLYGNEGNDLLVDDLSGAAQIDAGSGNDTITLTGYDTSLDTINGGTGSDTLNITNAGSNQWRVYLNTDDTGNMRIGSGTVYTNLYSIENVTVTGSNSLFVYANNVDNVITGGATSSDQVHYAFANAGVNINLATGVVTGGSGNDTLVSIEHIWYGSNYNDTLIGSSADNQMGGGRGADYIDGASGTDMARYDEGASSSVNVSLMNTGVNSALGITFTDIAAGDVLVNIEQLSGSSYSDILYGNSGANSLWGNNGDDTLEGMAGADYIDGGSGTDTVSYANAGLAAAGSETTAQGVGVVASLTTTFSAGAAVTATGDAAGDTYVSIENMLGSIYDDTLIGNNSANILNGGNGNDTLEGLAGADTFIGGNGNDTVSYAHSTSGVLADLTSTYTNTNDAVGDVYSSIENITGSSFNDTLYGNIGDNILDGGLGTNTLDGNAGTDTVSYASATAAMTIDLTAGSATGGGRTDTLVNIERVIGSAYADTITGTSGNDWIDAGLGADTVGGGSGTDTISYLSANNGITLTLGGSNTQNDTLTGIENIYGSIYGDALTGDSADNTIEGGTGNDTLNGSGGTDTVSYESAAGAVNVNLSNSSVLSIAANTATGAANTDTLSNFENIIGSLYNDVLIGDLNANTINGGHGDDLLVGGAGADTLIGGSGTDTVSYANAGAAITVVINGNGTQGDANSDSLSGIENIIGSAYNDSITGDANANTIDGGAGNDTINGGAGNDTINYRLASSAVQVNLSSAGTNVAGGAGNDSLSNIENITGSAYADTLTGDGNANIIEGGLGDDILNAGAGTDTLSYANATAAVNVNISSASVMSIAAGVATGADGNDTLSNFENITGSEYADTLIGSSSANSLTGGAGDDVLVGGAGADTLIGGTGTDTASYVNANSAISVTLGGASLTATGDAVGDTFSSIENLTGGSFNDTLYGDSANNTLIGGAGNDILRGYDGNDNIDMTSGKDTAFGGNGDDTFIVSVSSSNLPTRIYGEGDNNAFNGGGDTVKLSGLTSGQNYSLANLAGITDNCEVLNIRDNVNSTLSLTSAHIQSFVDSGNSSNLWIRAESGDVLNVALLSGESMQSSTVSNGIDYVIFNGSTQVAAIHWQTS